MSTQNVSIPVINRAASPQAPNITGTGTVAVTLAVQTYTATPQAATVAPGAYTIFVPVIARSATVRRAPRVKQAS